MANVRPWIITEGTFEEAVLERSKSLPVVVDFWASGALPFDARLDPSGRNLYVVDAALNAVSAFSVDGWTLTELGQSPFSPPVGATPFGIVVTGCTEENDN